VCEYGGPARKRWIGASSTVGRGDSAAREEEKRGGEAWRKRDALIGSAEGRSLTVERVGETRARLLWIGITGKIQPQFIQGSGSRRAWNPDPAERKGRRGGFHLGVRRRWVLLLDLLKLGKAKPRKTQRGKEVS